MKTLITIIFTITFITTAFTANAKTELDISENVNESYWNQNNYCHTNAVEKVNEMAEEGYRCSVYYTPIKGRSKGHNFICCDSGMCYDTYQKGSFHNAPIEDVSLVYPSMKKVNEYDLSTITVASP